MSAKGAKTRLHSLQYNVSQRRHLSSEAKRILSMLKNGISQVEMAAKLSATINSMSSAEDIEDEALRRALQKHQESIERLEMQEGLEQKSGGQREGKAKGETERARAEAEEDVKNSFRDLLRLVRASPDATSALRVDPDMEVGESESILIEELEKFHSHAQKTLQGFQNKTVYRDDRSVTAYLNKIDSDLEKNDATIKILEPKVTALQSSLQRMLLQEPSPPSSDALHHQLQVSATKQASIQQDFDQLKIQLDNLILENRQAEKLLMEKNKKVEEAAQHLVQDFDSKMEKTQESLEFNQITYEKESEERTNLEKSFSLLEVEYNQILEKRRLLEKKREEEMRELNLKTKAAILAQAWWRGYSTRKALKNKGKGKKAKKGKGKKKK